MFFTDRIAVRTIEKKGRGVFAKAEIEPGTLIGDYLGIVTKPDTGSPYEHDAVYDMWYSDKADIHPDPKEEGIHLLNASCEPNCAMASLGRHTVLFALRRIFPEEELTYDYFLGDQDDTCEPGTDNCHCGSDLCRGTMYSNPAAYAEWDAYLAEILKDKPEEPPVQYGERLPSLDHYPEKIEDDPIYPLFGTHAHPPLLCDASLFSDLTIREKIRSSGRQLSFATLNVVVEGIMYGGHLAVKHARKSKVKSQMAKEQEKN